MPLLSEHANNISLNEALFHRVKAVYDQREALNLSTEQFRLLEDTYVGFARNGANLEGKDKETYRTLTNQLSLLTLQFSENLLKETNDYQLHITEADQLAGLPESSKAAAQETAHEKGLEGWVFTLQAPSYMPFMMYAEKRELRKELYMAYNTKCTHENSANNFEIVRQLVNLRLQLAQLLGYHTYADYKLERRMAENATNVYQLLDDLLEAYTPTALKEVEAVKAIAKELDIVESREGAITGAELDKISDDDFFTRVEDINVYARVQPEHKTRIVDTWKKKGMVVAMTGDGVNDAPSIKSADIGVGMGITGTDVTKNVADMVLADDNFATIIGAVEEGRRIYDNIRKAIQFLLSSNLAEVIAVFVASLIGVVILEPTHLLWINLITDSLPALAMCMEEAEPDIMKRKPRNSKDGIFANGMGIDTLVQGAIIAALTLASYFIGISHAGVSLAEAVASDQAGLKGMTMAFLTLSMVEMFHSLNMRSRRGSIFKLPTQNGWAWGAFALALLLTWVVIETPLSQLFHFAELDLMHYGIAMVLAFSIIPIIEIYKSVMRGIEKEK